MWNTYGQMHKIPIVAVQRRPGDLLKNIIKNAGDPPLESSVHARQIHLPLPSTEIGQGTSDTSLGMGGGGYLGTERIPSTK